MSSLHNTSVSNLMDTQTSRLMNLSEHHYRKRYSHYTGKLASKRRYFAVKNRMNAAAVVAERRRQIMLAEKHHSLMFRSGNNNHCLQV